MALVKLQATAGQGGQVVVTAGINSVSSYIRSYPSSTVTVYQAGTLTPATIYSDSAGTPKANPFTASSSDASWSFYVAQGRYDIKFSGTGISVPFSLGDVFAVDITTSAVEFSSTDYASLNAAVIAIGSTPGVLSVKTANFPDGASCTVPSTLILRFDGAGSLLLTTGHTVIINSDAFQWPRRKIFNNATAGQGTISFSGNKTLGPVVPQWWEAVPTSAGIQAALTAVTTAGGGKVVLPNGQTYALGSTGVVIASDYVTLEGESQQAFVTYSGTGRAIDAYGHLYVTIKKIYLTLSNDAATGLRLGNASRSCRLEDFSIQGSNVLTNVGTGIDLDARGGSGIFSGFLNLDNVYLLGHKFGITIEGTNTGNETWTTLHGGSVAIVGLSAGSGGPISGSIGIKADGNSNLEGSIIDNLVIESYEKQFEYTSGSSCYGISVGNSGNEGNGNSNVPVFPASFNGEFSNWHGNGYYYRNTSNGLNNFWDRELRNAGECLTQSHGDKIHAQDDGSTLPLLWGLKRGGQIIDGEYAADEFLVSTNGAVGTTIDSNWFKLQQWKQAWASATPDRGSWQRGSIVWNSAAGLALPTGWVCTVSGTLNKTIGGATTAATTSGSANVTLSQPVSVATIAQNDYITIAGVSPTSGGVFRVKFITDSTHIVLSDTADATVAAGAVAYSPATFVALVKLNDPGIARVTAQFDKANNTLADVTGLSLMVTSGVTYAFTATLYTTSDVAAGVKVAIGGTATVNNFTCQAITIDGTSIAANSRTTTKGTAVGGVTAVTAPYITITGTIAVNVGGTLTVQFAQNATNAAVSSVLINSVFETRPIG